MVLFLLVAIVMFMVSVIMPNYVLKNSLSYFRSVKSNNSVVSNTSICCINDTYTCNTIIRYINESNQKIARFNEINIIIYNDFNSYMRSNNSCDIILGLNEFEYITAKYKDRIRHIDYFSTYSLLNRVPRIDDLIFKSLIVAVPYCYSIEQLEKNRYSHILKYVLNIGDAGYYEQIKIYRLIIVENMNNILENIISYIIENNTQIYNGQNNCRSVYYNVNSTIINNILSYYDIQRILTVIRGANK